MNKLKQISLAIIFTMYSAFGYAQTTESQKNFMTSNGKIYVVLAVVVTIVVGLFLYLMNLDRKISKLERKP
jgi:hypothetical protein